eukprot:2182016-Prymnesium_polylepis.2
MRQVFAELDSKQREGERVSQLARGAFDQGRATVRVRCSLPREASQRPRSLGRFRTDAYATCSGSGRLSETLAHGRLPDAVQKSRGQERGVP